MVIDLSLCVSVPSTLCVLSHLIYTTTQQGGYFHYSLLFRWINKVQKHWVVYPRSPTQQCQGRNSHLRLLTTSDLIIRLNFSVVLASCSWSPQAYLTSFQRTFFLFELVCVVLRSLLPNVSSGTGIGQTQAYFFHSIISLWTLMSICEMHWVQTLHENPNLVEFMVPWFAPFLIVT